jgi:hypothetical protein
MYFLGISQMRCIAFTLVFALAACGSETSNSPAGPEKSDLDIAKQEVMNLTERLGRATDTCTNGPVRSDEDGKLAMAEVDLAMADNIDNISPAQEQRIRASLGAEMGLAPSQVDGWKDIYRSRAKNAKSLIALAEKEEAESKKAACDYLPELRALLQKAQLDVGQLSAT